MSIFVTVLEALVRSYRGDPWFPEQSDSKAKVDSQFDYTTNLSSFPCMAWTLWGVLPPNVEWVNGSIRPASDAGSGLAAGRRSGYTQVQIPTMSLRLTRQT